MLIVIFFFFAGTSHNLPVLFSALSISCLGGRIHFENYLYHTIGIFLYFLRFRSQRPGIYINWNWHWVFKIPVWNLVRARVTWWTDGTVGNMNWKMDFGRWIDKYMFVDYNAFVQSYTFCVGVEGRTQRFLSVLIKWWGNEARELAAG